MKATYGPTGTIGVKVCYTHYGHTKGLEHVHLPKEKREEIAVRLQEGVTQDKNSTLGTTQTHITRSDLVDKQDLRVN